MEILKLTNVSKKYDGSNAYAVQSCDISVHEGERISIQGVSGSGKSTLLLMMSGLLEPTEGQVLWNGKNIYKMNDKALSSWRGNYAGYLFQNVQLVQALTIRENLNLARMLGSNPKMDIEQIIKDLALEQEGDRLPGQLSGGQRRRAMIGCVLARDPQIILADEPTNDLDTEWARQIMVHMENLTKKGRALVLVTHDPRWIREDSTRYAMNDGVLVKLNELALTGKPEK